MSNDYTGATKTGDAASVERALNFNDGFAWRLDAVATTSAKVGGLETRVWEASFWSSTGADLTAILVGVKIGTSAMTVAAYPTTGNESAHQKLMRADQTERFRILDATNNYVGVYASAAVTLILSRVGD